MIFIGKSGLIGSYKHSIDSKNRMFLPSKLKDYMGSTVIITRGLNDRILLYTEDGWENFLAHIDNPDPFRTSDTTYFFVGNAVEVDVDTQGRVTVPSALRATCNIGKDITVVGVGDRLELWNTADWEQFNNIDNNSDVIEAEIEKNYARKVNGNE